MQLTLFDEVIEGTHRFLVTKLKLNWKSLLNENGTIRCDYRDFTLNEIQEIIERAAKTERSRYGYEIYTTNGNENISIYIRFGNIATKVRDNATTFTNKHWEYH